MYAYHIHQQAKLNNNIFFWKKKMDPKDHNNNFQVLKKKNVRSCIYIRSGGWEYLENEEDQVSVTEREDGPFTFACYINYKPPHELVTPSI